MAIKNQLITVLFISWLYNYSNIILKIWKSI